MLHMLIYLYEKVGNTVYVVGGRDQNNRVVGVVEALDWTTEVPGYRTYHVLYFFFGQATHKR